MSESSGYNPNAVDAEDDLPQDFLDLDLPCLKDSASRQRDMADLRLGFEGMNVVVESVVISGRAEYEDSNVVRHINRGAALAQLLLVDSSPGFTTGLSTYVSDIKGSGSWPNSERRDIFRAAKAKLVDARRSMVLSPVWNLTPEEAAQNQDILSRQVDGVLSAAGLDGSFETALQGLTGIGLEEPTRELDAKYGAALVVLGAGIAKR